MDLLGNDKSILSEEDLLKPFGTEWKKLFLLKNINVNHGSCGAIPVPVLKKKYEHALKIEADPDYYMRYQAESEIKEFSQEIAEIVSADQSNIMIVTSASDGSNAFFKSIKWEKGDKLFFHNTVYGMTRQLFNYLKERFEVELYECILTKKEIENEEKLIAYTENFIKKYGPFKAANLEHVGSLPSLIYPIQILIQLFKKDNTIVLVDGAHAIGNIKINLKNFQADAYLSNLHKWMYTPRGTAFLYIANDFKKILHPNIISPYFKTDLQREFIMACTIDYSIWLGAREAINWRRKIGENKIQSYTNQIAWEAGQAVSKIWGTSILINQKERLASMINVECYGNLKKENVSEVMKDFKEKFKCFLALFWFDGKAYARFSGQIYNSVLDYEEVARLFIDYYNMYLK